jgi:hypothetical protein
MCGSTLPAGFVLTIYTKQCCYKKDATTYIVYIVTFIRKEEKATTNHEKHL